MIETINAFSECFALTATFLNADRGLIANRLSNLDHAIYYITNKKTYLQ